MHQQQDGNSTIPIPTPIIIHRVECGKSEIKKIQDRTMIKTQLNMLPETGDMYRKGQVLKTAIAEKRESAT